MRVQRLMIMEHSSDIPLDMVLPLPSPLAHHSIHPLEDQPLQHELPTLVQTGDHWRIEQNRVFRS